MEEHYKEKPCPVAKMILGKDVLCRDCPQNGEDCWYEKWDKATNASLDEFIRVLKKELGL